MPENQSSFLEINGEPIIIHTLDIFDNHPNIDEIYVACKDNYIPALNKMLKKYCIEKVRCVVPGGTKGMGSIYNALIAAKSENSDEDVVLVHDGVRPCISNDLVDDVIEKAIVKDPRSNIKVTTPEDLYIFKAMLEFRETQDAFGFEK